MPAAVQPLSQNQNYINYQAAQSRQPVDDFTKSMLQLGLQNGMGTYGYNSAIQSGGSSGLPLAMQYANRPTSQPAYNPSQSPSQATMTPQGSWQIGGTNQQSAPATAQGTQGAMMAGAQTPGMGATTAGTNPTTGYAAPGAAGATSSNAPNPLAAGGGKLNFGGVPTDYNSAYGNALNLNSQNYSNILSGYQNLLGSQKQGQQATQGRYDSLWPQVQQTIAGIGKSQQQAINDVYGQQSGNIKQQMINSGLGNTTAATSAQGVASLNQQKASDSLAAQLAQLNAGYQSQLGLAGAGYSGQANQQNTALGQSQLGWMNTVSAPYPNAKDWQNTAMMQGAANAYSPVSQTNPFAGSQNPYGNATNPYANAQNPYANARNPYAGAQNPYGQTRPSSSARAGANGGMPAGQNRFGGQNQNGGVGDPAAGDPNQMYSLTPYVPDGFGGWSGAMHQAANGAYTGPGSNGNNWTQNSSWWPNSGAPDQSGMSAGAYNWGPYSLSGGNQWDGGGMGGSRYQQGLTSGDMSATFGTPTNYTHGFMGNNGWGNSRSQYSDMLQSAGQDPGWGPPPADYSRNGQQGMSQDQLTAAQKNYQDILASLGPGAENDPAAMQWAMQSAGLA